MFRETSDNAAAFELALYIENDHVLYNQSILPIMANLEKKRNKGKYDAEEAVKAFAYAAEHGAKKYAYDFGGVWYRVFNPAIRQEAATMLRDYFCCDW